jgi:ATP-dependent DNA helicase RecG
MVADVAAMPAKRRRVSGGEKRPRDGFRPPIGRAEKSRGRLRRTRDGATLPACVIARFCAWRRSKSRAMITPMREDSPGWADAALSENLQLTALGGETQGVEFKRVIPEQSRDLAKEIAAFATSNDGVILIGVDDDGTIVGIADGDDHAARTALRTRIEGICRTVQPGVTPTLGFGVSEGKVVAALRVPRGSQPVYYSGNIPYLRQMTAARPMTPDEVVHAVLAWDAARKPATTPEDAFLGQLAGHWPEIDLTVSELQTREINPWREELRFKASSHADDLRRLAARIPHELVELDEPLNQLAGAFDTIAAEHPRLGPTPLETVSALQEAEAIITRLQARYLSPERFSAEIHERQRTTIIADAYQLNKLVQRIDSNPRLLKLVTIQSEARVRGHSLFTSASRGVGIGSEERAQELRAVAIALCDVELRRIYADGGKSMNALFDEVRSANTRLQAWIADLPA